MYKNKTFKTIKHTRKFTRENIIIQKILHLGIKLKAQDFLLKIQEDHLSLPHKLTHRRLPLL